MAKFDLRGLVATPDASGAFGKVNFVLEALPAYLQGVAAAARGQKEVTLTGAAPIWLVLAAWHECHGVVPDAGLKYEAPGVGEFHPEALGPATGDGSAIADGRVVINMTNLLPTPPAPGERVNFKLEDVPSYQQAALSRLPRFTPGEKLPDFEVILTGPAPTWVYLAVTAALHSRGGRVVFSAPNAPRVVIIDHK